MIRSITDDSRKVKKGDIFIAVRGRDNDGHLFIKNAVKNGANIIIADRDFKAPAGIEKVLVKDTRSALPVIADNFYGHPSSKLKLIGVTGTNGKTTITYLIESILKSAQKNAGVIGTINYRINGKSIPAKNTTPGTLELYGLLSRMVKNNAYYAVMEVSSHSLDQGRVNGLLFDTAIFTNITKEHLDYHKTLKNYFNTKTKLFEKLKSNGIAILYNDDKMVAGLKSKIKNKVLTYGIDKKSNITAKNITLSLDHSSFEIKTLHGSLKIRTGLIGRHNISNILAAVAAAISLGLPLNVIKRGIESFKLVPGRLETVDAGQSFKIFVDYAHTEDALSNILKLLKEVVRSGRIITVFGCGGNRDRSKRPLMGRVACRLSDRVIVTSDNPRFEDPVKIISEIESGIKGKFLNYDVVEDRRDAIEKALRCASRNDVVVIAGKGHETYQIIMDKLMPFDDRKVIKELMKSDENK